MKIALTLWLLVVVSLAGRFAMSQESPEVREIYDKIDIVGRLQNGGQGDLGMMLQKEIMKSLELDFDTMEIRKK